MIHFTVKRQRGYSLPTEYILKPGQLHSKMDQVYITNWSSANVRVLIKGSKDYRDYIIHEYLVNESYSLVLKGPF